MKMKNILMGLGATLTTITPISISISCGSTDKGLGKGNTGITTMGQAKAYFDHNNIYAYSSKEKRVMNSKGNVVKWVDKTQQDNSIITTTNYFYQIDMKKQANFKDWKQALRDIRDNPNLDAIYNKYKDQINDFVLLLKYNGKFFVESENYTDTSTLYNFLNA